MLWNDTRAQSIQIGAVLLFGVLVILLSSWQAYGIPNQNEGIEFNHNQGVQQQMTELRTTANSMPDASVTHSATVDLGVRYPARTIFRNPPPVAGTIRTDRTSRADVNATITNATATSDSVIGVGDFWDGTDRSYNTGSIEYRSSYNEYRKAPVTVYEHTVLYNRFQRENRQLPITDQALIRGSRINLIALNGSLSENRVGSTSIDFQPISTQTNEVRIKQVDDDQPITLKLPTRLDASRWDDLVGQEHEVELVEDVFPNSEWALVRIKLNENRDSYRLQMAKVGVGTDTTETDPSYIVGSTGHDRDVTSGEKHRFVVEVRDKFNRPIRGVEVTGVVEDQDGNELGGSLTPLSSGSTTGSDGTLAFRYDTSDLNIQPGESKRIFGHFSFDSGDTPKEFVRMGITVNKPKSNEAGDVVAGPKVEVLSNDAAVGQGGSYTIEVRANSIGDRDPLRSGTPIQNLTWSTNGPDGDRGGIIEDFDPDQRALLNH